MRLRNRQVAPDDVRQVVTGLQKHVPVDDLLNKKVVVIVNLKVRAFVHARMLSRTLCCMLYVGLPGLSCAVHVSV